MPPASNWSSIVGEAVAAPKTWPVAPFMAVSLATLAADGRFEVSGFSQEMPGSFDRFAVDLGTLAFGPLENLTLEALAVAYGDLATIGGGYGITPYGTTAIYRGGVLIELRS